MSNLIGSCTHWAFDDPSAVKTQDVATKPRLMHTSNTHGKLTTQRTRMDHEGQNRPHVHMSLLTTMKFYFFGTTNEELSLCFEGLTPLAMGTRQELASIDVRAFHGAINQSWPFLFQTPKPSNPTPQGHTPTQQQQQVCKWEGSVQHK